MDPPKDWTPELTEVLDSDIDSRILYLDDESIVLYANSAARRWLSTASSAVVQKPLSNFLSSRISNERLALTREALRAQTTITVDGLIGGEGLRCTIRPSSTPDGSRFALLTFCPLFCSADKHGVVVATENELGDLGRLTVREIEVFSMVARGQSSALIAYQFGRSRRTIDCHRASIGQKLNTNSCAGLVHLGLRAGLLRFSEDAPEFVVSKTINDLFKRSTSPVGHSGILEPTEDDSDIAISPQLPHREHSTNSINSKSSRARDG